MLTLVVDARLPHSGSLKDKRAVVRHLVDRARSRHGVAAAETGHQDDRRRLEVAFAAVSGAAGRSVEVIDAVERFVWSTPDLEVVEAERHWLETD